MSSPGASRSTPAALIAALRIRQWVKNLLIFVPTLLAYRYLEREPVLASAAAFLAFSLLASAVYVLNDLVDVEADRRHPRKRHRPFAAGELSVQAGIVLFVTMIAAAVGVGTLLPARFLAVLGLYFLTTTAYTMVLKKLVLIDTLVLAGLYTLRIIAGSAASGIPVSEWLLAFSLFLFLSLAAVKRFAELLRLRGTGATGQGIARRGYLEGDAEVVSTMGLSAGYIAVLVLALYITSDAVTELYRLPHGLWFACPLLLYWVSRIWLLAHRGIVQDDPLDFAVRDPTTWVVAGMSALVLLACHTL